MRLKIRSLNSRSETKWRRRKTYERKGKCGSLVKISRHVRERNLDMGVLVHILCAVVFWWVWLFFVKYILCVFFFLLCVCFNGYILHGCRCSCFIQYILRGYAWVIFGCVVNKLIAFSMTNTNMVDILRLENTQLLYCMVKKRKKNQGNNIHLIIFLKRL